MLGRCGFGRSFLIRPIVERSSDDDRPKIGYFCKEKDVGRSSLTHRPVSQMSDFSERRGLCNILMKIIVQSVNCYGLVNISRSRSKDYTESLVKNHCNCSRIKCSVKVEFSMFLHNSNFIKFNVHNLIF